MPFKKGETPKGAKPFQKGQSGNPNGQPKKIPELNKLLADVLSDEKDGIEAAKAILMALRAKATKGDVRAAEVLLDRAYGKAKQIIDNNISVNKPIIIDWSGNDNNTANTETNTSL
jgi:hypothetical protein